MIPLPPAALNVVGSARKKPEYNLAREEWACEVMHGLPVGRSFAGASVEVVFYVSGARPEDGKYRPRSSARIWPVLEAVYAAVVGMGYVDRVEQIPLTSVGVLSVDTIEEEHVEVRVSELGAPTNIEVKREDDYVWLGDDGYHVFEGPLPLQSVEPSVEEARAAVFKRARFKDYGQWDSEPANSFTQDVNRYARAIRRSVEAEVGALADDFEEWGRATESRYSAEQFAGLVAQLRALAALEQEG